jgi:hypothetical protein
MAGQPGINLSRDFTFAYRDVAAAWRYYLHHDNRGRPFVLIGHSQGSIMLAMLLAREIEGKPIAGRMLSAMLIGYSVHVPQGKLVGGTFKTTPLCTRPSETGCIITFAAFRAGAPPPFGSAYGRALEPGMTVGCTNPARLAGGSAPLDSYWYARSLVPTASAAAGWSSKGSLPAPFIHTNGLVTGACVNDHDAGYLAITVNADPKDARTDRIPGDFVIGGKVVRRMGLHLVDMNIAMGNLLSLVKKQSAAYRRAQK